MRQTSPSSPRLSLVVPVFNSAAALPILIERVAATLDPQSSGAELILVDDCSGDSSWQEISRAALLHPWVRGMRLMRNFGQHSALLAGIRAARGDVIVTLDDDLQHPPEEIPILLAELDRGFDVVYGSPREPQQSMFRRLASKVTRLVLHGVMGVATAHRASAFRAFRAQLRVASEGFRGPHVSVDVLLSWATTRFSAVSVRHDRRYAGVSGYSLRRLFAHAIDMMTGFSTLPLRLASLLGLGCSFLGVGILAYVVGRYLFMGSGVPGFSFLASTIAIFSGVQLFCLGIIGEYLARVHFRIMDKPTYVVSATVNLPTPADAGPRASPIIC